MNESNSEVLAYLADKSAHDGIASVIVEATAFLGDAQIFCPDWHQFRYVAAHSKGIIFGIAVGMDTVAFMLEEPFRSRGLATGGTALPECGADWVSFIPFRDDWPRVDFEFWARKAYIYAREIGN